MMKALVVDDEKLARQNLTILLSKREDVHHVFEAKDGLEAIELAKRYQPDLIYLDIEMPIKNGIEVAEELMGLSAIIFVTAYDNYAIQAFQLNAIDYLLKPYDDERFTKATDKAIRHIGRPNHSDIGALTELLKTMKDERLSRYKSRLVVKDPGKIRLLPVNDVEYVMGSGNYVEIHMQDGTHFLHRETMFSIENQLDPMVFIRVHRSSIVNVSFISELLHNERGDYRVKMKSGKEIPVSRANKNRLLQFTD
ncbi:MAG: LytTR family DNA-binding domain-containing protein [Aliiglaciecola sp.]